MTESFKAIRQGAVQEVIFAPPFGVALDAASRAAFVTLLGGLTPEIRSVLIRAGARRFSGGLDLPRGDDAVAPDLAAVCAAVEGALVPVTFLVEGQVSGALAEVALAATYRISPPGGRMVIGEVALGLISGAGGTQRLAALVGAEHALRLMRGGVPVTAAEALALGLIDRVIEAEGREALHALARDVAENMGARAAPSGLRDARGFMAAVAGARAAARGPAGAALVDCIEAAILLPRPQGLAFEAAVGVELGAAPEAAALCHIHLAERQVVRHSGPKAAPVAHLGLIGAMMPLVGVVLAALSRGVGVTLVEDDREALVAFLKTIAARQEASVQSGQMTEAERDADWARLVPVVDVAALATCDLVIGGDGVQGAPGSWPLLVTGRGALPPGAFRLTLSGRVAEVGLPPGADPQEAAQVLGFLRHLGMMSVPTGTQSAQGIAARLAAASGGAVRGMVALGVAQEAISAALTGFDLPAPPVTEAAAAPTRDIPADEIVNRLIGAMANEGARLLAAGMAQTALDIDVVAVHGLGFPRHRGGPLHQAERRGLLIVRRDLTLWADQAEVWRPVPALDAFVSAGRGFAGLVRTA